ncbi:hypothetical protein [Bathymodiolus septemdierum thioautotrophic gill symbiont]|nr:hypothetical protein [Bathymodiolus septemdierum thioautotrophic gill symbiont]
MTWSNQTLYDVPYIKVLWKGAIWENIFSTIGEEPGVSEVWHQVGVNSKDLNSWDSEYIYQDIDTAVYWKGFVWRNTAYTINEEPGESEVWKKIGLSGRNTISKWSPDVFYKEAGEVVFWNGRSWRSIGPTKGAEPGKFNDWERIGYVENNTKDDEITWQANKSYNHTGIVVKHNSIIYSSRRLSIGEEPGTTDAWVVVSIATDNPATKWLNDRNYNINDIVIYDNKLWQAAYKNIGERPSYAEDVWSSIVIDSDFEKNTRNFINEQVGIQTDSLTKWDINKPYPEHSRVVYKGRRWENLYYSSGETPGVGINWVLLDKYVDENGILIWQPFEIYRNPGTVVSHNGKTWHNKWYTVGDEPGIDDVWSDTNVDGTHLIDDNGIIIWQSEVGYEKTLAVHNGKYYKNRWYADAGLEPGQSNIWYEVNQDGSNLTDENGAIIWQSNAVYESVTLVVHNGKYYKNKWYADPGLEPGQSNIWYEVNQDGSNLTDENGAIIWQSNAVYESVTLVVHNGKYYKNKWYADPGSEPGQSNIWYEVNQDGSDLTDESGAIIWQSDIVYESVTLVVHNGKYYKNKWYADPGLEPGQSNIWYEVNQDGSNLTDENGAIIWQSDAVYESVTLVVHNGKYYKNKWYADPGSEPGQSNIWYEVNQDGSDLTDESGAIIWQSDIVYESVTLVVHNGKYYKNKWYADPGLEPGQSNIWYEVNQDGSNLTDENGAIIWQSDIVYESVTLVVHNGKYYKNKWYADPGSEPGQSNIWYEVNQDGN